MTKNPNQKKIEVEAVLFDMDGTLIDTIGLIVAGVVIIAGIGILNDIVGNLIGKAPDPELVKSIEKIIKQNIA